MTNEVAVKHTWYRAWTNLPGDCERYGIGIYSGTDGEGEIAYVCGQDEKAVAAANLIAAAPDLLTALKNLDEGLTNLWGEEGARIQPIVQEMRAAIAKAEGR